MKQALLIALVAACNHSGLGSPPDGALDLIGAPLSDAATDATADLAGGCAPAPADARVHCGSTSCNGGTQACCLFGARTGTCIDPQATACGPPGEVQCASASHCAAIGMSHCCFVATVSRFDTSTCPATLLVTYGGDQRCSNSPCAVELCATSSECASGRCLRSTLGLDVCATM